MFFILLLDDKRKTLSDFKSVSKPPASANFEPLYSDSRRYLKQFCNII